MRASAVIILLVMLPTWCITLSAVFAQSALERLERQIRQRVGTREPASSDTGGQSATRGAETRRAGENVEPGYLGAVADDRQDRGRGVRVLDVQPGSPAEEAGLRRQDLITAMAGNRVRQMSEMSDILSTFGPGETLDFDILRDGRQQRVRVVLGQRPAAAKGGPALPETVPLPRGEAIPAPPEPQAAGPQLQPPKAIEQKTPEASRIEQLERRISELERRVEELERTLKTIKKD